MGLEFWWQVSLPTEASNPPKYFILMRRFGVYLESFMMVTDCQKDHSPTSTSVVKNKLEIESINEQNYLDLMKCRQKLLIDVP